MTKRMTENEVSVIWILADIRQRVLIIPKSVKQNAKILSRAEAALYLEYKTRYPEFDEVII